jgi:uncharacterized protein (TIGR01619 family)
MKDEDKWDFYFTSIDDNPGSIFLNLSLAERAPLEGYEHVIHLRVTMNEPRADGLSSSAEFDALVEIENAISNEIGSVPGVAYVGRATHAGVREFTYYATDVSRAESLLRRAMAAYPIYAFELSSKHDPDWDTFWSHLMPSAHDQQRMANRGVYESLEENGDPLTAPREIDHWAYFPSASARDEFLSRAATLGYSFRQKTDPGDIPEVERYGAQIFRLDVPSQDFDDVTLELFDLAQEYGGEYDGWESPVEAVKKIN